VANFSLVFGFELSLRTLGQNGILKSTVVRDSRRDSIHFRSYRSHLVERLPGHSCEV
jgi:hypothetical protein